MNARGSKAAIGQRYLAGDSTVDIAEDYGISRQRVEQIAREQGIPHRRDTIGLVARSKRSKALLHVGHAAGSGLGRDYDRRLDRMNVGAIDQSDRVAKRTSSDGLLRAQLKAGQHVLELTHARIIALAVGLPSIHVRPGIGDRADRRREAR